MVRKSLDDDKAQELVVIDLEGKSSLADHLVIATGTSQRHVCAMAERLQDKIKGAGTRTVSIEGVPQGDWVLLDAGDVIVHLFRSEVREFYALEKMWGAPPPAKEKPKAEAPVPVKAPIKVKAAAKPKTPAKAKAPPAKAKTPAKPKAPATAKAPAKTGAAAKAKAPARRKAAAESSGTAA
jgi:ribosome-associated protein